MKPEIIVHADLESLSHAVADRFVALASQFIVQTGRFTVALSGGSTPRRLYQLLGSPEYASRIEWANVHLFQVDERAAPPDHAFSNFRMIRESLLDPARIPAGDVHRILGELPPPKAAKEYERELETFFSLVTPGFPRFDLVFLGMGEDGHTASLFPGSRNLIEMSRWVVPTEPGPEGLERVTLTLPVLNHAAHIIFLVTGSEKSETLARVLEDTGAEAFFPVQRINPRDGSLVWNLDAAAASRLKDFRTA